MVFLLAVGACASQQKDPDVLGPQSVSQATLDDSEFEEYVVTQEEEPAEEPVPPAESTLGADQALAAEEPPAADDETVIIIEDGPAETEEREPSLVETARAERRRRESTEPARIVITDKNLADYATGELTVSNSSAEVLTDERPQAAQGEQEPARGEAYWRERGYAIRLAWKEAAERIEDLEGDVFNLRMRFYSEDDPFYRDSQIKPAWDQAIEELSEARAEVEMRREELAEFLEEGRVAGVLPGWLREGVDLEPEPLVEEEITISEPGEPPMVDRDNSDPTIAEDPGGGGS